MPAAARGLGEHIPTEVKDGKLVAKRRRQIVDAAVRLFIEGGFHKTTTRQIAKAAGLAIGTLYEYVTSKEDMLSLVCQAIHQEIEDSLARRLEAPAHGSRALEAAIRAYFAVCHQMQDHILLIYQETKSLPPESMRLVLEHELRITGIFVKLLHQGMEDYTLRRLTPEEVELAAHNIVVLGHMWAFRRWSLSKSFNLERYVDLQCSLIMGELI
ncbi:MAG: TetR/AcrR family transcriptional regulator [Deltaproteobacteria bacterium]|nr:TetR/AcrR family transcriptional regulator [Deltaproteobacteria bacterium]